MKHHFQPTDITQLLPVWLAYERVQLTDLQLVASFFAKENTDFNVIDFFEKSFPNSFFYTKEKNILIENNHIQQSFAHIVLHDETRTSEIQIIEFDAEQPIEILLSLLESYNFKKNKRRVMQSEQANNEQQRANNEHQQKGILLATPENWYFLPKLSLFELNIFFQKNDKESLQLTVPFAKISLKRYKNLAQNILQNSIENTSKNNAENYEFYTNFAPLAKLFSPRNLFAFTMSDYGERWAKEMTYIIGSQTNTPKNSLFSQAEFALEQEAHPRDYAAITREYGDEKTDRQRGAAQYLTTLWLGRILFAKIVETRLIRYHASDDDRDRFRFLNTQNFGDFKALNAFFKAVFQTPNNKRTADFREFAAIPFLNAPIFDTTNLEEKTVTSDIISNKKMLPLYDFSLLKNKEKVDKLPVLAYLLALLEKADFGTNTVFSSLHSQPETLQMPLHILYSVWEYWVNATVDLPYFTPQSNPNFEGFDLLKNLQSNQKFTFVNTGGGRIVGRVLAKLLENTPIENQKTGEIYDLDIHFANDNLQPILPNGKPLDYQIRFERRLRKLPLDLQAIQESIFYSLVDIFNRKIQLINELQHLNWATSWRLQAELLQFSFYKQGNNTQLEPFPTLKIAQQTACILYERPLTNEEVEQVARKEQRLQKLRRDFYAKFPPLALVPMEYSAESADEHQVLTREIAALTAAIAGTTAPKTPVSPDLNDGVMLVFCPQKTVNFQKSNEFLQTIYQTNQYGNAVLYIENLLYRSFKSPILIAIAKEDLRTAAWKKLQNIAAQQHKKLWQIAENGNLKYLVLQLSE